MVSTGTSANAELARARTPVAAAAHFMMAEKDAAGIAAEDNEQSGRREKRESAGGVFFFFPSRGRCFFFTLHPAASPRPRPRKGHSAARRPATSGARPTRGHMMVRGKRLRPWSTSRSPQPMTTAPSMCQSRIRAGSFAYNGPARKKNKYRGAGAPPAHVRQPPPPPRLPAAKRLQRVLDDVHTHTHTHARARTRVQRISMLVTVTSDSGLSFLSTRTFSIWCTMSMPAMHRPKIVCLLSSHGCGRPPPRPPPRAPAPVRPRQPLTGPPCPRHRHCHGAAAPTVGTTVMKNCEPLVLGPAFAIETVYGRS